MNKKYRIQVIVNESINVGNGQMYESVNIENLTFEEMCEAIAFLKLVKEESKNANPST